MNDFELESKLKSVRVPERPEDYWENFPSQVRVNLRRAPVEFAPRKNHSPRLAWACGMTLACAIFTLMIVPAFQIALKDERVVHRELAQLPQHLRVLMADEHGLHYLVADQK